MSDPRVWVAQSTRDDAAVFQISPDRALVATVDFFAPVVDDPYAFGAIAAANALSDLYAMGAAPLFGLNILAWPRDLALLDLLGETLRGGSDVANRAGAFVLGGHSVDDPEPKFGMVAIGEVHPNKLITNATARPGDLLVLTKPIGTGVLTTALKRDLLAESGIEPAVQSMMRLNDGAMRAMQSLGSAVHAATDVTGFGLMGHLRNMLAASQRSARVWVRRVPLLDRALELAERGAVPGGSDRNREASDEYTRWGSAVDPLQRILMTDAQTSGGLLIAVEAGRADALIELLDRENAPYGGAVVGEIVDGPLAEIDALEDG